MPRTIHALLVSALLVLAVSPARTAPGPDSRERITQALLDHGFENVAVSETDGVVSVWFENRMYRHELIAIGVALLLVIEDVPPDLELELIPGNRGVSLVSITARAAHWSAFMEGRDTPKGFVDRLTIRTGRRFDGGSLSSPSKRNRSQWKTDVALRPLFGVQLGFVEDHIRTTTEIAPEAVMSPFTGGLVTVQAAIRLQDDLDPCGNLDPCGRSVTPVRNTLSWGGWLTNRWLLATSVGLFPGDRYGLAAEVGTLVMDGQLELWAGGDLSGNLQFLDDVVNYSDLSQWSSFVAATARTEAIDLEGTLKVGRFREEKLGVRVDLERRVKEFEIGFFFVQNEDEGVAGLNLRIPLPVRKNLRPGRVRPVTVPAFPFRYRESPEAVVIQVSFFDNLDRMRKRLYPTYIRNNIEDLRIASRYTRGGSS